MSGHNRWSKIKRKKEVQGAAKGKLFSKLINFEMDDKLMEGLA
jgi:transcriptional/translational regulatory protein YebC/TACO1